MLDLPIPQPPHSIIISINEEQKEEPPTPITHTVVKGDNLTKLSEAYSVPLERLWAANPQLQHPDQLNINEQLNIPLNTDVLTPREMPSRLPVSTSVEFRLEQKSRPSGGSSVLIGSIGYARAGGNCVNEPGVNSPHNGTNPISWAVLSRTPTIGATALFRFNHTGVVVGIWSNGDLEIRHQNYSGGQHRFPASAFRGYR